MPVPLAAAVLPPYYRPCAGIRIPSYTPQPSLGEESLSRSTLGRVPPAGEFTTTNGSITLTLKHQLPHATVATYAPTELVTGSIQIQAPKSVTEVILKVTGRMDLAAALGGRRRDIVKESYTVWHNNLRFMCPPSIPFSFIFPSTFTDEESGACCPLPPTMLVKPPERPFIYAKCSYAISVLVSTALHPKFSLWRGEKILDVAVNVRPIASPSRPILPDPNLLTTVKSTPEEWHQVLCTLGSQLRHRGVDCSLFIPSSQTYALDDTIPFHLQVTGPAAMLRGLVTTPTPTPRATSPTPTTSESSHSRSKSPVASSSPSRPVRVYLLRKINLVIRGDRMHRSITLGEGLLSTLPPPISITESRFVHAHAHAQIDWGGEIRVHSDAGHGWDDERGTGKGVSIDRVSTFNAGPLWIEDYIVVSIPQWDVEHRYSIRFVSDTWMDDVGPGDRVR
ncbi:hypothetical protein C8F01DRAFT_1363695 [Mycena amicta]|nr:hypothetical protein C8F01DRAFT_1363695 [Mycena amicta]